jgi:putative ABC transport system permease protein
LIHETDIQPRTVLATVAPAAMSLLRLAWLFLWSRPLVAALNLALLTLGVAGLVFVLSSSLQLQARAERALNGIDLVVGAKGSPLQLVLAGLLHLDAPTGNIPFASVSLLAKQPLVAGVVPLALGDSYRGFRIVGTQTAYLDWYGAKVIQGAVWKAPMEVVLGHQVAAATGLAPGQSFAGNHGLAGDANPHAATPFRVVGLLAPCDCVLDQLVLTDLQSVWEVHEAGHAAPAGRPPQHPSAREQADAHHKHDQHDQHEVSLLLVRYHSPLAAASLPRWVNAQPALQAASPALESAKLMRLSGLGIEVLRALGALLMAVAAGSIFVAMSHAVRERTSDLAMMRMLGATPVRVAMVLLLEALLLAALGGLLGLLLGLALTNLLGTYLTSLGWGGVSGWWWHIELGWIMMTTLALGALACAWPCWRVYRSDITFVLQGPG